MRSITIQNMLLRADIRAAGGELVRFGTVSGVEFMWGGDPKVWPRHSPVLFPVVGRLKDDVIRHEGAAYPMPRHGFARDRRFTLMRASRESCTYALTSDPETLAVFPFPFELRITYTLTDWRLMVIYEVVNLGSAPMPASLGAHPAFRWPLFDGTPRNMHRLLFEKEELEPVRRLNAQGLLEPEPCPTPVLGRVLPLQDSLFEQDALVFDQIKSRQIRYEVPGCPSLQIAWAGFEHLGLWTKPGAGFLCIEPWHGLASAADETVAFAERPGTFMVLPGERRAFNWSVTIVQD